MANNANEKKKGFFSRLFGGKAQEAAAETPAKEEEKAVEESPIVTDKSVATAEKAPVPVKETSVSTPKIEVVEKPLAAPFVAETPAAAIAAEETAEEKRGFFQRLKQRLGKTKVGLVEKVMQVISFHTTIDEALIEDLEIVLVQADVGIETTTKILGEMRKNKEARRIEDPKELLPIIKESILNIVSHSERTMKLRPQGPTVILVIGVNGTGKTTTIGKLAKQYRDAGKRVMMVAGDTFRAAAVEQLTIWAERTGSHIVKQAMGADPGSVCFDALNSSEARNQDVILIDTAGRLHTKSNLMEELKKIVRVIKKVIPDAPHETLLVLDATTGQNALSQAKLFSEAVNVTGLVMTKLDGTAKGGILIALRDTFDIPVLKIGIGESAEDFRDFDPNAFVDALFES